MNLYAYCGNDPIGCIDPTGMMGHWKFFPRAFGAKAGPTTGSA